ncbi:MAG: hypothetical protein CBC25_07435 [Pelagibacteraceae bacterium TMED65]|nr:tetrahydromethanopterin synthesis protein [Rickettsiales bacterium]OUU50761.1 MAG: hypothetical protein CBC25_07435 [Pelagibacteraceae bacterium TMED65]|tara:strand:+ start:5572 stop:6129 length:558 start_codon:yes stop_codon:yes gene_type:complete
MIFETIVSTINNKGQVNFAPFGIRKRKEFIFISPYIPSKTLENLKQTKCASINYLDDSSYFVKCIVGKKKFSKKKCLMIKGFFIKNTLSHDEVVVESVRKDKIRPIFKCKVVKQFNHKRFEGFNRANGALIEACILASRVKILEKKIILKNLDNLSESVLKTAGVSEKKNWNLIRSFILNATKKI